MLWELRLPRAALGAVVGLFFLLTTIFATREVIESDGDDDAVSIVGFGTFLLRERAARTGRNPKTGKAIEIAASKAPAFKAGKAFKDAVN